MITTNSTQKVLELEAQGFQGFNPLSTAQIAKLTEVGVSAEGLQVAKFKATTVVTATDDDAGNGSPVTYDRISVSTDYIYADSDLASEIATSMLDDETIEVNVSSYGSIDLTEDVIRPN